MSNFITNPADAQAAGANIITGTSGNDTLTGTASADFIHGGLGQDRLAGGDGNDTLVAGSGSFLNGGGGADAILVGRDLGTVTIVPDANDTIVLAYRQDEISVGKPLNKWASAFALTMGGTSTSPAETLVLQSASDAPPAADTVVQFADGSITTVGELYRQSLGFSYNLTGASGNDVLTGWINNDRLNGGAGNDTLYGDAGNDTLIGGPGDDKLNGGSGSNTYIFAAGDGHDTVDAGGYQFSPQTLQFTDLNLINLTGLTGWTDNAPSTLHFESAAGGLDIEIYDNPALDSLHFADGSQVVLADLLTARTPGVAKSGTAGRDTLTGGYGADTLNGLAGNDVLLGGAGNDSLSGGAGNDSLDGGPGADVLDGGAGADTLVGGAGNDTLKGGTGDDLYIWSGGADVIVDNDYNPFNRDVLQLSNAISAQVWFSRSGNDLVVTTWGYSSTASESVKVADWFVGASHRIESIVASGDQKAISAARVNALVSAMASQTPPIGGDITSALSKLPASLIQADQRAWTPA